MKHLHATAQFAKKSRKTANFDAGAVSGSGKLRNVRKMYKNSHIF